MKRFTKADLRFLKSCGIAITGLRARREASIECQQIFTMPLNSTEKTLQELGLPLTRENYLRLECLGDPPKDIDQEVIEEFPEWLRDTFEEE